MKKIKVFAFPSHATKDRVSGVDFVRIIQPMTFLGKEKGYLTEIYDPFTKNELMKPRFAIDIAQKYNIIFMNYIVNDWGYANIAAIAKKKGVKLVMDIDDALWHLNPDNPAYEVYKKGSRGAFIVKRILEDVDHIVTTNNYLRNVLVSNLSVESSKITVIPNYIDLSLYKYKYTVNEGKQITITHFGSTTHFIDLMDKQFVDGMDRIMKEFPQVVFKTVGAMLPELRSKWGARYINDFGDRNVLTWINKKYPHIVEEADIFVTPLASTLYNKAKSSIKFLEVSASGKPGVWQNMRQYKEVVNGENGFLAETSDEWYIALKKLIKSKELRQKVGENAYRTVRDNWRIEHHISEYKDLFEMLLTPKKSVV